MRGDPSKALKELNFKFKYKIKDLVKDMIDLDIIKAKKINLMKKKVEFLATEAIKKSAVLRKLIKKYIIM